jgi:hypothetical protein
MVMPEGQRYAAGPTVYSNGMHNPTDGTVDPTGYIDRELNKMPSQTRSGLASAALQRVRGNSNSSDLNSDPNSDYIDPYAGTPATLRPLASVGDFYIDEIGQLNPLPPPPPPQPMGMPDSMGMQPQPSPIPLGSGPNPAILQAAAARVGG